MVLFGSTCAKGICIVVVQQRWSNEMITLAGLNIVNLFNILLYRDGQSFY